MREFESGATRDTDDKKHDYEGFLSYPVIRRFGQYMHAHRVQADGKLRDSDNWQKGMPQDAYMKSGWRHFMDWWGHHRGEKVSDFDGSVVDIEDALCALIFNAQGYLHEILKTKAEPDSGFAKAQWSQEEYEKKYDYPKPKVGLLHEVSKWEMTSSELAEVEAQDLLVLARRVPRKGDRYMPRDGQVLTARADHNLYEWPVYKPLIVREREGK